MDRRIPSLDGLRAVSIFLVLLGHIAGTGHSPAFLKHLEVYAQLGVLVFFVISGFLITTLLMKEMDKTGTISLKDFYIRRAYRILPAAYTFTTVAVILYWKELRAIEIIGAYLYFQNYVYKSWVLAHLWSLSIEEQFYLAWPLVCTFGFIRARKVAIWTIALSPIIRTVTYFLGFHALSRYSFTVADSLATGCLLAMAAPSLKKYNPWLLRPMTGLALAVFIALVHLGSVCHPMTGFYNSFGVSFMQLAIAALIYNCIHLKYRVLNWAPLAFVGVLSYSLYLWQQVFINRASGAWYSQFPQNVLLAFVAAAASYFLVEKPTLAFRKNKKQAGAVQIANAAAASGIGGEAHDKSTYFEFV